MHIIPSWALCPTCLPRATLLNWQITGSSQLACVGNPNHAAASPPISAAGTGLKSCSLPLPPLRLLWEPVLLEQVCRHSGKGALQSLQLPPLPMTPHPAAALLAASQCWTDDTLAPAKSHQSSAAKLDPRFPLSKHTCRLAAVAFCDSALFWRSRFTCLCTCLEPVVHWLRCLFLPWARAAFPRLGKVHQCRSGRSAGGLLHRFYETGMEGVALGCRTLWGSKKGLACLKFIDTEIYIL